MFETETMGPFRAQKLKWGGRGVHVPPCPLIPLTTQWLRQSMRMSGDESGAQITGRMIF